jgi:hypothetical protein
MHSISAIWNRHFTVLFAALSLSLLLPQAASAGVDPEIVVKTSRKLDTRALNNARTFPADGQILERNGLLAKFNEGTFRAIEREDGRIVGLIFEGVGQIDVRMPAGVETTSWQAWTNFSPLNQPINAAVFRFSDLTLDDLQGEREWVEEGDADASAFRIFEARTALLETPEWTRRAPALLVDRLMDLYGGGAVGGHVLAEFRLSGDGPPSWLSYYHNPRGALMLDETTAWYRVRKRGSAPPLLTVLTSSGKSGLTPEYDVQFTDLDVTFPTSPGSRDMSQTVIKADIGVVSLATQGLRAVVLELESVRKLCMAQPDRPDIRVRKVTDQNGNSLAAVHRKNRLFIPLAKSVPRGEAVTLSIEYEGPMTQGIPTGPPDTMFSELGPWAWYPRNPRLDRFASKVVVHLPRYMRGVAPGDLTEVREEKDGWHYTFEEPGGVRNLTLVVGDLVMTKDKFQGSNPRIIGWVPRDQQETVNEVAENTRNMIGVMNGLWGPYPYSTLHVVNTAGHPYNNWRINQDGAGGSWECLPNNYAHPWEPYVDRPSGMLLGAVISPPSFDVIEERLMGKFATDGLSVGAFMQFVELSRQWWGHMVPPKTYRDVWVTEALAVWTGLVYLRAGVGTDALKEKSRSLSDLAAEGVESGLPLSLGGRLDRNFLFQAWGRGPLMMNTLIDEVGGKAFMQAANTLINRTSGPGITSEVFLETLASMSSERVGRVVHAAVEGVILPEVEYLSTIDKEAGEVRMTFTQVTDPIPTSITVQLVFSPKQKETRSVRLEGAITEVVWPLAEVPKRLVVDPFKLAMVKSIKKAKEPSE